MASLNQMENKELGKDLEDLLSKCRLLGNELVQTKKKRVEEKKRLEAVDQLVNKEKGKFEKMAKEMKDQTELIKELSSHLKQISDLNLRVVKLEDKYSKQTIVLSKRESELEELKNKSKEEIQRLTSSFQKEYEQMRKLFQDNASSRSKEADQYSKSLEHKLHREMECYKNKVKAQEDKFLQDKSEWQKENDNLRKSLLEEQKKVLYLNRGKSVPPHGDWANKFSAPNSNMTNSASYHPHQPQHPPYNTNTQFYQQHPSPNNGFDNYPQVQLPVSNPNSHGGNNNNLNGNMNLNLYPYNPPQPSNYVNQTPSSFSSGFNQNISYNAHAQSVVSHTLTKPQSDYIAKEPPKQSFPSFDMIGREPMSSAWQNSNDYQPNISTLSSASTSNSKAVELANERIEHEVQPTSSTNQQKNVVRDSVEQDTKQQDDNNEQNHKKDKSSEGNEGELNNERKVNDSEISSILKKADSVKKEKRKVTFNLPEGYSEKQRVPTKAKGFASALNIFGATPKKMSRVPKNGSKSPAYVKLPGFSHGERTRTNKTPYKIPLTIMNESRMQNEDGEHADDHDHDNDQGRNKRKLDYESGLNNAGDNQWNRVNDKRETKSTLSIFQENAASTDSNQPRLKQAMSKPEGQENTARSTGFNSMEQSLADQRKRFKFVHKPSRGDDDQNPRHVDDLQQNLADFKNSAATGYQSRSSNQGNYGRPDLNKGMLPAAHYPVGHPANHLANHPANHPVSHPANHPANHPSNHQVSHPAYHPVSHPSNEATTSHEMKIKPENSKSKLMRKLYTEPVRLMELE